MRTLFAIHRTDDHPHHAQVQAVLADYKVAISEPWPTITKRLNKEKYQLSAARWHLRGLPFETAIRKVETTGTQGHEINFRRQMRYNDD